MQGIGVRLILASGLWLQTVVKVEVKTDDRDRVHELGRIIISTTNLSSTFITCKVLATHAIYHVIGL